MTTTESNQSYETSYSIDDTLPTIKRPSGKAVNRYTPIAGTSCDYASRIITGRDEEYRIVYQIPVTDRSEVFRARGQETQREVVIKKFFNDYFFSREKEIQELLRQSGNHENVLLADEFLDEQMIMISPYMKGGDVWQSLKRADRLASHQLKSIFSGLCDALQYLHDLGIVHRDVKPRNIVLKDSLQEGLFAQPTPKLFDYETSWHRAVTPYFMERPGCVVGSANYLAPELVRDVKNDPRSDVYAAGVTLYFILTGNVPFKGDDLMQILQRRYRNPVPQLAEHCRDANAELQQVVEKALAINPNQRYQTAAELKKDFLEAYESISSSADSEINSAAAPESAGELKPENKSWYDQFFERK